MEFTNITGCVSSDPFGISRASGNVVYNGVLYSITVRRRAHTNIDDELRTTITCELRGNNNYLEARRTRYEEQRGKNWYGEEDWVGDLVMDDWEPFVLNENVNWVEKVFDAFIAITSEKE